MSLQNTLCGDRTLCIAAEHYVAAEQTMWRQNALYGGNIFSVAPRNALKVATDKARYVSPAEHTKNCRNKYLL